MVAGNTRVSSSTVHFPCFWMVLTGSGSFSRLIKPSVTWKTWPFTWVASSETSHVTMGAMSFGPPRRVMLAPVLMPRAALNSRASSGTLVIILVEALGEMALAVTPYRPMSRATTRVKPAMPRDLWVV